MLPMIRMAMMIVASVPYLDDAPALDVDVLPWYPIMTLYMVYPVYCISHRYKVSVRTMMHRMRRWRMTTTMSWTIVRKSDIQVVAMMLMLDDVDVVVAAAVVFGT